MMRTLGPLGLVASLAWGATPLAAQAPAGPGDFPISPDLPPEARQFDFWVGEWDVNLRILQADGQWQDAIQSTAHIYPILRGKAVLELWSDDRQTGIKGYSLRHWNAAEGRWDLWLNWPGPNRSGTGAPLTGSFRHGRGEFFARGTLPDGTQRATRYTFSDISPTSLRWDDAVSTDGGRTWSANWIMEFTRTGAKPTLSAAGGPAHTYHDGSRCSDPEFAEYAFLAGRHDGSVVGGGEGPVTITGHQVLDGCAVLTFAGPDADPETAWGFSHVTWNGAADRYELSTLIGVPGASVQVFHAPRPDSPGAFEFVERPAPGAAPSAPRQRMQVTLQPDGSFIWSHLAPDGSVVWSGRVGPADSPAEAGT